MGLQPGRHGQWDVGNANFHEVHGGLVVWPPGQAAGTGLIPDELGVIVMGHNDDIDIAAIEETNDFGDLTRLTAASTFDVVSDSSADDNSTGTGAWAVVLTYLDANYEQQTETVILDGLTPVTTTGSGLRLISAVCGPVGTGGQNAGNISITATTGGTTQGYINAGEGRTHTSAYTVPAGYTAIVLGAQISIAESRGGALKETSAYVKGIVRVYNEASTNNYNSWFDAFQVNVNNRGTTVLNFDQSVTVTLPAKTDIKMTADVSVDDTQVTTRLFLLLRED